MNENTITPKEQNRINLFIAAATEALEIDKTNPRYIQLTSTARLAHYNLTIEGQEIADAEYFNQTGRNWDNPAYES